MEASRKLKGGSANKKMKKFPRITDYLEAHHKEIYDLFEDLAMHGSLTPRRGGCITFLLPDEKLIKEIRKTIESDKPEDATDMLSALILTDLFEDASDFKEKQDDIPNLLGKRLVIKGVAGNKVMVEGGELTVDSKFKPFERQGTAKRGNLAVWNLKGTVDYLNAPAATFKNLKKGGKPKKGGVEEYQIEAFALMRDIVDKEVKAIANGTKGPDGKFVSPMLCAVARVLRVLKSDPKYKDELHKVKSILTKHHVIDFYLLFNNPVMIAKDRLVEIYKAGIDGANDVDTIINFVKEPISNSCYALEGVENGMSNGLSARADVIPSVPMNLNIFNKIKDVYNSVDENNLFMFANGQMDSTPVYPENVTALFKAHKGMHLRLDEFKFFVYTAVKRIRDSIPDNWDQQPDARSAISKEYNTLFIDILVMYPKLGHPGGAGLLDALNDVKDVNGANAFWQRFGLHLPGRGTDDSLEQRAIRGGEEDEECDINDIETEIEDALQQFSNCDMCLSQNTVNELKAYMKANGGKMPEL